LVVSPGGRVLHSRAENSVEIGRIFHARTGFTPISKNAPKAKKKTRIEIPIR
jgi:hypothetical protein